MDKRVFDHKETYYVYIIIWACLKELSSEQIDWVYCASRFAKHDLVIAHPTRSENRPSKRFAKVPSFDSHVKNTVSIIAIVFEFQHLV